MDFEQIVAPLKLTKAELSRALRVSDGHVADLFSRRRPLTLKVAVRLEELTGRDDIVIAVAAKTLTDAMRKAGMQ